MRIYDSIETIIYVFFLFYINKPIAGSEDGDSSEAEKAVDLPRVQPPYAQIPTSGPRKLKTLYEALASDQSIIRGEQDKELYGFSSGSPSPSSSLSGE